MPRYDYRCTKCKKVSEETRWVKDMEKKGKCPKCGSKTEYKFSPEKVEINIPAWFHKPIPDSAIKAAQRNNPDLERAK